MIGFEELGQTDSFTSKTLEWRLKSSGVLHDGATTLNNLLPDHLRKEAGSDEEDNDEDEQRFKDKSTRKGKFGIRNGLAASAGDDDDPYA